MSIRRNHYLERRGHSWYYVRRVPARYREIDTRFRVKAALHTDSLTIAREKRDAMMDADEHFWETSLAEKTGAKPHETARLSRYRSARRRAQAVGFEFKPLAKIATVEQLENLLSRTQTVEGQEADGLQAEAVFGNIEPPKDTIREAFKLYCDKLNISETSRKSPEQIVRWRATKARAVEHFVTLCGNITMDKLTRAHGRAFYDWWGERLRPDSPEGKSYRPNSANRELGNLRQLFREYWTYQGEEERENWWKNRFSVYPRSKTYTFG